MKTKKFTKNQSYSGLFTEEKIDWLIDVYLGQLKSPYELIVKTVERSRDRFLREYSKFEGYYEQQKFFTAEGIKERKEKIKLKVMMSQMYGAANISENKNGKLGEIFTGVP